VGRENLNTDALNWHGSLCRFGTKTILSAGHCLMGGGSALCDKGVSAPVRIPRCSGFVNKDTLHKDTLTATKSRTNTVRGISSGRMPETMWGSKNGVKPTKFVEMAIHVVKQNKMKIHFVIYLRRVKKYF